MEKGDIELSKIEVNVEKLVKDKIEEIGYILYDVEYAKEGKDYFLRIFIDKKEGIDLNDCEKVNDAISDLLDKADYIKEQYYLEVSSPGIERVLRKDIHFEQNVGNEVNIKLFRKDNNGKKEYVGFLKEFDNECIKIEVEGQMISINRKDIAHIRTIYNW